MKRIVSFHLIAVIAISIFYLDNIQASLAKDTLTQDSIAAVLTKNVWYDLNYGAYPYTRHEFKRIRTSDSLIWSAYTENPEEVIHTNDTCIIKYKYNYYDPSNNWVLLAKSYRGENWVVIYPTDSVWIRTTGIWDSGFYGYMLSKTKPAAGTKGRSDISTFIDLNATLVYPNPCQSFIKITLKEAVHSIELLNMNGKTLLKEENVDFINSIDLSGISKGIYFIRVTSHNSVYVSKLIKE
jgi:hypothetical protein